MNPSRSKKEMKRKEREKRERERESFSESCCDIDTASVRQLREFWESVVVDSKPTVIGDLCLGLGGVGKGCLGGVAKDVCHDKCNVQCNAIDHPFDTSATTTTTTTATIASAGPRVAPCDDDNDNKRQQRHR